MGETWWRRRRLGRQRSWRHAIASRSGLSSLTKPRSSNKRGKGRSAFFVVWVGRRPGLYTTWEECEAAVAGVEGAKFKGFDLLENAKRAWRDGAGS